MTHLFTDDELRISVRRNPETNKLTLHISSDYSGYCRKEQLRVHEDTIAKYVESAWKSIKTKKLTSMRLYFSEIDWYDNMTNIYYTPVIIMAKRKKKAEIRHNDHGSIPKDWSVNVRMEMEPTISKSPVIEVIRAVLGNKVTVGYEKFIEKELRPVLQGTKNDCFIHYPKSKY